MNYKDKRWIRKREIILKRDTYLCRECKRYGKVTPATTVHHVKPVDTNPKLKLSNDNLLSLCGSCHNAMHDRTTDTLTTKGLEWVARLYEI